MSDQVFEGAVRVERVTGTGMITVRGDLTSGPMREAVQAATGLALPETRGVVVGEGHAVAWMSPDELLVLCDAEEVADKVAAIGQALTGTHHLVVDVSDARAHFRLTGAGAREVLAKGAPVDLSKAAFGPGQIRRTRLGQVAVAFWMSDEDQFDLVCFCSVNAFVFKWLSTAARAGSLPGYL